MDIIENHSTSQFRNSRNRVKLQIGDDPLYDSVERDSFIFKVHKKQSHPHHVSSIH